MLRNKIFYYVFIGERFLKQTDLLFQLLRISETASIYVKCGLLLSVKTLLSFLSCFDSVKFQGVAAYSKKYSFLNVPSNPNQSLIMKEATNHAKTSDKELHLTDINVPKLWGSTRLIIILLMFFAVIHVIWLRFNFSLGIVCMTGTDNNATDAGYIEGEFDWSRETTALLLSSFFYGYMCTQILGGYLADQFGEKWTLLIGMFLMSLTEMLIPVAARLHWGVLLTDRILQGVVTGFAFPAVYTSVSTWSSPAEKATLNSITFSAVSICQILNPPISGLLCLSGIDHGWPLIFYVPGSTCLIWCVCYYFLASNRPEDHPRISNEEKDYLLNYSCRKVNASKIAKTKRLKVPWIKMLLSVPVHALWFVQLAGAWTRYQASLNLPIFINETFDLGIVYVSKNVSQTKPSILSVYICRMDFSPDYHMWECF